MLRLKPRGNGSPTYCTVIASAGEEPGDKWKWRGLGCLRGSGTLSHIRRCEDRVLYSMHLIAIQLWSILSSVVASVCGACRSWRRLDVREGYARELAYRKTKGKAWSVW